MNLIEKLETAVSSWPGVTSHPHRFGGKEFRYGSAEIGHVHRGGVVDIPFPRSVRDTLLKEGRAQQHHWVPNSGWTTFQIRTEEDVAHGLWLLRLSYLRYKLKSAREPVALLEQEGRELQLSAELKSHLAQLIPAAA